MQRQVHLVRLNQPDARRRLWLDADERGSYSSGQVDSDEQFRHSVTSDLASLLN